MKEQKLNSLFVWYPLIKEVVPTPKTIMIPMEKEIEDIDAAISPYYGGEVADPEMKRLMDEADKAAISLGGYPVFVRSDETSHKHDWKKSCFADSKKSLSVGIANIYEFTLMNDFGTLAFGGIVVRELLELPHEFHAFNGMPVSKEFRFFVKNGKILCRHPYWFPACMRKADTEDWLQKLRKIQVLEPSEQMVLDSYALAISKAIESLGALDNYWSIDFCYAKGRGWLVTDMALGEDSYHYSTCPNSSQIMQSQYGDPEDMTEATSVKDEKIKAERLKAQFELLFEKSENAVNRQ